MEYKEELAGKLRLEDDDYLTIKEAADRMNIPARKLRYILQQGKVDFGFAFLCDGEKYQYLLFRKDFDEFIRKHSTEYYD